MDAAKVPHTMDPMLLASLFSRMTNLVS